MLSIFPFDLKNLPLMLKVVFPMWKPPVGDDDFKRLYVETVVRSNIFENQWRFQLEDDSSDSNFCAAAFFMKKGDVCTVSGWLSQSENSFTPEQKELIRMCRTYLEEMDRKTLSFMTREDVKLSLFISVKPGCGSKLLNLLIEKFKSEGYKNLFLWTDCECNWQWYEKNGYQLVEKSVYEPFCSGEKQFTTYIFKKPL